MGKVPSAEEEPTFDKHETKCLARGEETANSKTIENRLKLSVTGKVCKGKLEYGLASERPR